jgi:uncharacterized LabA/DUF88 family protein
MKRVAVFIDGFNLYHALDDNLAYHKYKWLNLAKFSKCFTWPQDNIVEIFYFTSYVTWNPGKLAKHQLYVKALQLVGVKPIFGAFRMKDTTCRVCHKHYQSHEEKQTDVNIAIKLFQTATTDLWDTAIIISGDSDLIPAIEAVKKTFPTKKVGVAIPIGRRAEELKLVTDFHRRVKTMHLQTCQFDDAIPIDGAVLQRPASWK